MASFEVESYTVSVAASSGDTAQPRLLLVSPDLSHGIRNRVSIAFESNPATLQSQGAIGYVLNVGGLNFDGITMYGWMSPSMFDDVYDIVRNESPIQVVYNYKNLPSNPSSTTKYLTNLKIGTERETPGEGDPDGDAVAAMVLQLASEAGGS